MKAKGNKRFRKNESSKNFDETFDLGAVANDRDKQDEFCLYYYHEVKGLDEEEFKDDAWYNDPKGFPTMKEIVMGLWELICEKIDFQMKHTSIE